jgi:hypothetical protein
MRAPGQYGEVPVHTIHCHFCGGVVRDPKTIQYRPPRASAQFALPGESTCDCTPPIVYEDSPLDDPPVDDEDDAPVAPAPPDPWRRAD